MSTDDWLILQENRWCIKSGTGLHMLFCSSLLF